MEYMGGLETTIVSIVPMIVIIGFIVVLGTYIVRLITGAKEWSRNNRSPVLSVEATVVAKRAEVSHPTHYHKEHRHRSTSTSYYVTFELASADRMELSVSGSEYGMLVEGDFGKLTFQGTRYKGFACLESKVFD